MGMYWTDLNVSTTLYNNPIMVSLANRLIKSPLDTFQRPDVPCKQRTTRLIKNTNKTFLGIPQ